MTDFFNTEYFQGLGDLTSLFVDDGEDLVGVVLRLEGLGFLVVYPFVDLDPLQASLVFGPLTRPTINLVHIASFLLKIIEKILQVCDLCFGFASAAGLFSPLLWGSILRGSSEFGAECVLACRGLNYRGFQAACAAWLSKVRVEGAGASRTTLGDT